MNQDELTKNLNVQSPLICRDKRDEVKPSIEMAAAIAEALEIFLDYLVGNSDCSWKKMWSIKYWIFKNLIQKIKDISAMLDAFLQSQKAKKVFAS